MSAGFAEQSLSRMPAMLDAMLLDQLCRIPCLGDPKTPCAFGDFKTTKLHHLVFRRNFHNPTSPRLLRPVPAQLLPVQAFHMTCQVGSSEATTAGCTYMLKPTEEAHLWEVVNLKDGNNLKVSSQPTWMTCSSQQG